MAIQFQSKLPHIGTSIFPLMTALANEHHAINLAQGFPGFSADRKLLDLINKYIQAGNNQYAPLKGYLPLKERIAEKIENLYGRKYHPDTEICITAGATQGIYSSLTAFVNEGDEVIVFEPTFDIYEPSILINKGIPVRVNLGADGKINWSEVREKITNKTKIILLNSPQNPLGYILKEQDITELKNITLDSNIIIISDEVYEHITFDNKPHLSLSKYPELAKRTLITCSFGKTYHITGWRIGYVYGPDFLIKEFVKIHQFQVYAANTPVQYALADYAKDDSAYANLSAFFQEKRDFFLKCLEGSKWKWTPTEGTYFQMLDFSNIAQENDVDFARKLTIDHGVASIPISVFYRENRQQNLLRFCFAKKNEDLEQAAERLTKL